jgi:hypothetical protein
VTSLIRRLVILMRMLAVAAGAVTALAMGAIVSLQLGFWLMTNTWSPIPISRIFELSDIEVPRRYLPAGMEATERSRAGPQDMFEWLLDLPAIVALAVVLAVLAISYVSLAAVEKGLAAGSGVAPRLKDS